VSGAGVTMLQQWCRQKQAGGRVEKVKKVIEKVISMVEKVD
jgi:hypothetical protein